MIIVTGSVRARPDALDEVLRLSLEHVQRSRQEPGCLLHSVHQDVEDPHRVVFLERWADRDALEAHFRVAASRTFVMAAGSAGHRPTHARDLRGLADQRLIRRQRRGATMTTEFDTVAFNLLSEAFQEDPAATFAELRERCPVHHTTARAALQPVAGGRRRRRAARRRDVVVEVRARAWPTARSAQACSSRAIRRSTPPSASRSRGRSSRRCSRRWSPTSARSSTSSSTSVVDRGRR